jgi:hypothetical protein
MMASSITEVVKADERIFYEEITSKDLITWLKLIFPVVFLI